MSSFRYLTAIFVFVIFSCKEKKGSTKINNQPVKYIKKYDTLNTMIFFDSLLTKFDCEEDDIDIKTTLVRDSINEIYQQLIIRLDSVKSKEKIQYAVELKRNILKSNLILDSMIDSNIDIFFYSFGKASSKQIQTQCCKLSMLKKYLLFLKAIFENSYWNYDFDKVKS